MSEIKTRVSMPLSKSNRLFRDKRNNKLPHPAVFVQESPKKTIFFFEMEI